MEAVARSRASAARALAQEQSPRGVSQASGAAARPAVFSQSQWPLRGKPLFCRCGKELKSNFMGTSWQGEATEPFPNKVSRQASARMDGSGGKQARLQGGEKQQTGLGAAARDRRQMRAAVSAVRDVATEQEGQGLEALRHRFEELPDGQSKYRLLLQYAAGLPRLGEGEKTAENRVMGCTAQVYVTVRLDNAGLVQLGGDSDSELSRGLVALLVTTLGGRPPADVLAVQEDALAGLQLGSAVTSRSRINGFYNMLESIKRRTRALVSAAAGEAPPSPFPSLLITAGGESVEAQGEFAVAQAKYLSPDPGAVAELVALLKEKKIGVVAHFYMDPQVQGVLAAAQKEWPHIHISDSLVMADRAVSMAKAGCERIAVLGVDFMSENVRAILSRGGYPDVPVYRMAAEHIGCSLAEAAESQQYMEFLEGAAATPGSLHVIYINTSLNTKAEAHARVPTTTCTSSNVVQTVLQAFAQVPEASVFYGPDSYMGGNLGTLLRQMATQSDEEVAKVHPQHTQASIRALLPRLHYFQDGTCMVHDMFGQAVTQRVRTSYGDAYQAAHFEVPGEMFDLALEASRRGMGTVGSTKNILDFIADRTQSALEAGFAQRLQFVLGTEAGMVTSIVNKVKGLLREAREKGNETPVEVEVVFPVSVDAITPAGSGGSEALAGLSIVPGVASGEGCSTAGGCASCPYMKMNSLDALLSICRRIGTPAESLLTAFKPRMVDRMVAGHSAVDLGSDSILHMRHFQTNGRLSDELVHDIKTRNQK